VNNRLADDNVKRLLLKLSMPAVTGMFVLALYNLVDTIFVGRGVGTMAIAGLSVVFPLQMIVMSVGMLFGIGGASVISRFLGAGNTSGAARAYGNIAVAAVVSGVLLSITGLSFSRQILGLFGASAEIMPYASDYYGIIIFASPLFVIAMTGNNVLRSVGMAKSAMTTMITGAVANIILDPIFIFGFGMGVKGAALATVISQFLAVSYQFSELRTSKSGLSLNRHTMKPDMAVMRQVVAVGLSSFVRNVAASFVFALVNNRLLLYGSELSIAVYGITVRLARFLILPLIGIAQGLQPIVGYNWGAGRVAKAVEASATGLLWASAISFAGFALVQLFPSHLVGLFTKDPELLAAGRESLRLIMLGLWGLGFHMVGTSIFQATGKAGLAMLLSMSREVLFFIPCLFILPSFLGLDGVWISVPVADFLAFLITLIMVLREKRSAAAKAGLPPVRYRQE
jgi:putative MATE family efflux protein